MVDLSKINNIYLYGGDISFRYGIISLSDIITTLFTKDQIYNSLFVFFSKNRKQMKILEFENDRTWLYQCKLTYDKFIPPTTEDGILKLDKRQLEIILKNVKKVRSKSK